MVLGEYAGEMSRLNLDIAKIHYPVRLASLPPLPEGEFNSEFNSPLVEGCPKGGVLNAIPVTLYFYFIFSIIKVWMKIRM
jgi:hypothetical protein